MKKRKVNPNSIKDFLNANQELTVGEITKDNFEHKLGLALNFYRRNYDNKDSKKFLLKLRKDLSEPIRKLTESEFSNYTTLGFTCKFLIENEISQDFDEKVNLWIEEKVNEIKDLAKSKKGVKVEEKKKDGRDVQKAILNQIKEKLPPLDQYFDDIFYGNATKFKPIDYIKETGLSTVHIRKIHAIFQNQKEELVKAYSATESNTYNDKGYIGVLTEEKDLNEAYSFLSKVNLKKIISGYDVALSDINAYIKANSTRRASTKKKKPISIKKQISKVKYLTKSEEYGITSLSPDKIIGSQIAILFNVKTRKLSVFHTNTTAGLQIKGTTIENFDVDNSVAKTVRASVNVIDFTKSAKTKLLKSFKELTTVEAKVSSGRINADTIILNAFK